MKVEEKGSEADSRGLHWAKAHPTLLTCSLHSRERQVCPTWVAAAAIKRTWQGKERSKRAGQDSSRVEIGL